MSDVVELKISVADAREYRNSRVCQCGQRKGFHHSLCFDCLQLIPELLYQDLRKHLFLASKAIGREYAEALENALVFLDLPLPPAHDLKSAGDRARGRVDKITEAREGASLEGTFYR